MDACRLKGHLGSYIIQQGRIEQQFTVPGPAMHFLLRFQMSFPFDDLQHSDTDGKIVLSQKILQNQGISWYIAHLHSIHIQSTHSVMLRSFCTKSKGMS